MQKWNTCLCMPTDCTVYHLASTVQPSLQIGMGQVFKFAHVIWWNILQMRMLQWCTGRVSVCDKLFFKLGTLMCASQFYDILMYYTVKICLSYIYHRALHIVVMAVICIWTMWSLNQSINQTFTSTEFFNLMIICLWCCYTCHWWIMKM